VGFEPTVPASERAKTVHALDRSANVIGGLQINSTFIILICLSIFEGRSTTFTNHPGHEMMLFTAFKYKSII
jgi:hypothetical protein